MNISINIQGFTVSAELDSSNNQQQIKIVVYSQTLLSEIIEFIAPFITTLTLNGVYYETTKIQDSLVIITFKKACNASELINIFNQLEEEFS